MIPANYPAPNEKQIALIQSATVRALTIKREKLKAELNLSPKFLKQYVDAATPVEDVEKNLEKLAGVLPADVLLPDVPPSPRMPVKFTIGLYDITVYLYDVNDEVRCLIERAYVNDGGEYKIAKKMHPVRKY